MNMIDYFRQLVQVLRLELRRPIYFDNNATTPIDPRVHRFTVSVQKKCFGNPSSLHLFGMQAREIVEAARRHVANIIGAESEEIIFTGSGTEANNTVIKSVASGHSGGHFITSAIEHPSSLQVFKSLEKKGYRVTYLGVDADGRIRIRDLKEAIRPDTVLISVMHVNNELGSIQPIEDIAAIAKSKGIPFHTDAVQSFGKLPIDVKTLPVDYLSCSAHKINGPKGIGAIFVRRGVPLTPLLEGGHQERLLRAGTEALVNIAGFGEACKIVQSIDMNAFHKNLHGMKNILIEGITKAFPAAKVNCRPELALPTTLNMTLPGVSHSEILAYLDFYKTAISVGSACVAGSDDLSHVLVALGASADEIKSSFRISLGKFNTEHEARSVVQLFAKFIREREGFFSYVFPGDLLPKDCESGSTIIVDVRGANQLNAHPAIPGAIVGRRSMREWKSLPHDKEVVFICEDGYLSTLYSSRLRRAGWTNVKSLMGGYKRWRHYHREYYDSRILKGSR